LRTSRFYAGQIVAASVNDGIKSTKVRPVVIIDDVTDCGDDDEIMVVFISSNEQVPCPAYHVKVHGSNTKNPVTGLSVPSWAKCNLPRYVPVSRIKNTIGKMPDVLLRKIVETFDALMADDAFDDWP
jgi:uncharacterized protein YifN (PemK superfamily)